MYTKTVGLLVTIFALAVTSFSQTRGMQIGMMDGSVRSATLQVQAVLTISTEPLTIQVSIARLRAATPEACMASTDFSAAKRIEPWTYRFAYDKSTQTGRLNFGVEREMKESGEKGGTESTCHVVRFDSDGDVDGRDFLIWQRGNSPSPISIGPRTPNNIAVRDRGAKERYIKVIRSNGS